MRLSCFIVAVLALLAPCEGSGVFIFLTRLLFPCWGLVFPDIEDLPITARIESMTDDQYAVMQLVQDRLQYDIVLLRTFIQIAHPLWEKGRDRFRYLVTLQLFNPEFSKKRFDKYLHDLMRACRRDPSLLAALKTNLTVPNVIYLTQRLYDQRYRNYLNQRKHTDVIRFFVDECESECFATYQIGQLLRYAALVQNRPQPDLDRLLNRYLPEVMNYLPTSIRERFTVDTWQSLSSLLKAVSESWLRSIETERCESCPLELHSALVQIGAQFALCPSAWSELTVSELRSLAPYLQLPNCSQMVRQLISDKRPDLLEEVFQHRVLIWNLLEYSHPGQLYEICHRIHKGGHQQTLHSLLRLKKVREAITNFPNIKYVEHFPEYQEYLLTSLPLLLRSLNKCHDTPPTYL